MLSPNNDWDKYTRCCVNRKQKSPITGVMIHFLFCKGVGPFYRYCLLPLFSPSLSCSFSVSHTAFCKCLCTVCLYPCSEHHDTIMLTYSYQQAVHHYIAERSTSMLIQNYILFAHRISIEVKVKDVCVHFLKVADNNCTCIVTQMFITAVTNYIVVNHILFSQHQ